MKQKLTKGKYTLNHERYIDEMGLERDSFDLFDEEKRIHRPFWGKPKVANVGRDFPISRIPYEYTDADYEEMLDEQITAIQSHEIRP